MFVRNLLTGALAAVFLFGKPSAAQTAIPVTAPQATLYSHLEIVRVPSGERREVYQAAGRFEAPNWSRDGKFFIFNRDGHIWRLPVEGGEPKMVETGFAAHCNNDHGISPDGKMLVISNEAEEGSVVYVLPFAGGTPRRLTKAGSYWHGWSPDGKSLAFVGRRNGDADIYTVALTGGGETRLTTAKGLDDGPDYAPDGKHIYFNSERTGHMQIWRMNDDGSGQQQVFSDERNNWFPHISPDGKWMVFLTYERNVSGHPPNKNVMLRLMNLQDRKITVLAKLFGGQGTINVNSWAPDSQQLAFVSYELR